jgi:hypothetical protein
MKKLITICAVIGLVFSAAPVMASVTIDFGPALPGAPTGYATVLTNQLSSYGVLFSTTDPEGVYWFGPGYPWVPARYSIAAGDLGVVQFVDPIRADFSPYVVEASIRGFNGGGDIDTLILNAYDSSDILVDSMSITDAFSSTGLVATVSAPEIAYITFEVSVAGQHGLFFDDLNFVPVPAPGAIMLGGIGVGLVGWLRRRRTL